MAPAAAKKMTPISDFNPKPSLGASNAQAGFTLLELLLVFTIIGMASVLIVPNITSLESRTFSAQIRQANSLLNYARRIAVVNGQPSTASFIVNSESENDPDAETQTRRVNPVGDWKSEGIQVRYRDSTDREVEIDDRVDIVFYPEGGSTGGTFFISMDDNTVAIEIDPFTGRISNETLEDN